MAAYYERMLVADIAALKALDTTTIPQIADGIFIAVRDIGNGDPDWYYYDISSFAEEDLPNVVTPTSGTGRWFRFLGQSTVVISSYPDRAPRFIGEEWIVTGVSSDLLGVDAVYKGLSVSQGALFYADSSLIVIDGGAWVKVA